MDIHKNSMAIKTTTSIRSWDNTPSCLPCFSGLPRISQNSLKDLPLRLRRSLPNEDCSLYYCFIEWRSLLTVPIDTPKVSAIWVWVSLSSWYNLYAWYFLYSLGFNFASHFLSDSIVWGDEYQTGAAHFIRRIGLIEVALLVVIIAFMVAMHFGYWQDLAIQYVSENSPAGANTHNEAECVVAEI